MSKLVLPFVRSPYNYDREEASDASGLKCEDQSLAQQQFAEESDINTIVRRFGLSGELPEGARQPVYGDFTGISDYHQAANAIALANESFDAMPAAVRARFQNDPAAFVDFCVDPANREEVQAMGLVEPSRAVQKARPAPQPATPTLPVDNKGPQAPTGPVGAVAAPPPAGGAVGGSQ